ncbi:MAG: metallophosphoesterase [Oscillospiraceae bacterium]|jgi:predicted MPP superfamily phosphohydrolase
MKLLLYNHKKIILFAAVLAFVFFTTVLWTIWENRTVGITTVNVQSKNIPASFNGFKIAQISDLHNAEFGDDNKQIIGLLKKEQPDIIILTGDLLDSHHTESNIAVSFVKQAMEIAPCYYVTGNHEAQLGEQYVSFEKQLESCGVSILHNQTATIERNGEFIQILGVDDPSFSESDSMFDLNAEILSTEIERADAQKGYKILLSHRPEAFDVYVEKGIDLVFCGHAHGGQFRLPFVGGLAAPNQGLFPKYDGGTYQENRTTMLVSRGIGNSIIPFRIGNQPELVVAILHRNSI